MGFRGYHEGKRYDRLEWSEMWLEATIRPLVTSEENNGGSGQGTKGKLNVESHGGPSLHTVGEEVNRF